MAFLVYVRVARRCKLLKGVDVRIYVFYVGWKTGGKRIGFCGYALDCGFDKFLFEFGGKDMDLSFDCVYLISNRYRLRRLTHINFNSLDLLCRLQLPRILIFLRQYLPKYFFFELLIPRFIKNRINRNWPVIKPSQVRLLHLSWCQLLLQMFRCVFYLTRWPLKEVFWFLCLVQVVFQIVSQERLQTLVCWHNLHPLLVTKLHQGCIKTIETSFSSLPSKLDSSYTLISRVHRFDDCYRRGNHSFVIDNRSHALIEVVARVVAQVVLVL